MPRVVALRGATTIDSDTREQVLERTGALIVQMMQRNDLGRDDVISMLFTASDDVTAEFPAAAVRAYGIDEVPVICARELGIVGGSGIALCIRTMVHAYSSRPRSDLRHVYLHGARGLRRDLQAD